MVEAQDVELLDDAGVFAVIDELGREFLPELLEALEDDVWRALGALETQIAASDAAGAAESIHAIKGAAATVAMRALSATCCAAEKAALAGQVPTLQDLEALRALWQSSRAAFGARVVAD